MIINRSVFFLLSVAAVGMLTSCGNPEDRILEQTITKTLAVEPGARVSIRNLDGAIRVYGGRDPEMKIEAVKRAYVADRLDKIAISVTAQPNSVAIDTIYPPRPKFSWSDRSGTVDYTIVLPQTCTVSRIELTNGEIVIDGMRDAEVTAKLVNGRLLDHNGYGKHDLFVSTGALDLIFDWWEHRKFSVKAKIADGDVRAFIPTDSSFHLAATAVSGTISNDFEDVPSQPNDKVHRIEMDVGDAPLPSLALQAADGDVSLTEANP